jgi:ABC-type multidrug transport system ATPase subunit
MEIQLNNVAKKFNREWIFKNITLDFSHSDVTAITGPNGSGKSTLLQVIAGSLLQTEGTINYSEADKSIRPETIYRYISLVAPALSLPEDFTLSEFLTFHFKFKKLKDGFHVGELPATFRLQNAADKFIKNFSTGMKQRLKLGVALYADTPLLLLDEPATNLDKSGFDWYLEEIHKVLQEKMIFVCSNRKDEYSFCSNFIDILAYKK